MPSLVGSEMCIRDRSLTESVDMLRGLVGTKVKLGIAREGEDEPLEIIITRAIITVEAVKFRREGNVAVSYTHLTLPTILLV